ncbi:MAG: hypothetical protein PHE78_06535 [Candidatus Gastranaerophilales bacterium]|nr:hypothetical protein [Candidatus Gastranaerophilales bacterium]
MNIQSVPNFQSSASYQSQKPAKKNDLASKLSAHILMSTAAFTALNLSMQFLSKHTKPGPMRDLFISSRMAEEVKEMGFSKRYFFQDIALGAGVGAVLGLWDYHKTKKNN